MNTKKEMTQEVLLDKIYNEGNLNDILKIMTSGRFKGRCIRRKYKRSIKENKCSHINQNISKEDYESKNQYPKHKNKEIYNSGQFRQRMKENIIITTK